MTRRRKPASAASEFGDLALRVLVVGLAISIASLLFGNTLLGAALKALLPIGLLMVAGGAAGFWFTRRKSEPSNAAAPIRPLSADGSAPGPRRNVDAPVDRAPTERLRERDRARGWGVDVFEAIEWRRFEALVERLFQQAGFETRSQSHGADGGVDVWLYSRHQTDRPVSVVQCKHWSSKRVGVDKIRELRGVMAAHAVARGQFATTSTFTPDAIEFASANGVNLLDIKRLLDLIAQRSPQQQAELLGVALEGDYWKPTCASCGVKLIEREPTRGGSPFWGCRHYPRCKTTMPMRARG
jgi:restriction system protein